MAQRQILAATVSCDVGHRPINQQHFQHSNLLRPTRADKHTLHFELLDYDYKIYITHFILYILSDLTIGMAVVPTTKRSDAVRRRQDRYWICHSQHYRL